LILRLGGLLRKVLASSAQPETALADEVEFVKSYVEIEQMRLGDRLQVHWEIAPDSLQTLVPSMILQPLIENAIQHGIAPLKRPGKLWINAHCEDGFLHLQVRDSGPGLNQTGKRHSVGLGLSNTEARLRRLYGEQQRFELRNNDGLEVNVRLPFSPATTANNSNESSRPGS
jgi:two-component system LytT family sensor kinase